MIKEGFDNQQYLKFQSEHIRERIAKFGGKLYMIHRPHRITDILCTLRQYKIRRKAVSGIWRQAV